MIPAMVVVPPGGGGAWHYQQPWNGRTLPFYAEDRDALEKKIRDFRIANDLDPQTVTSDLDLFYYNIARPQPRKLGTLRERVTNWVANRKFSANEFVDPEVANARAAMVAKCPYRNNNWGDSCKDCTSKVFSDSFAVRAGKTTTSGDIGACEVVGWDNTTAVHLSTKSLRSIVQVKNMPTDACCQTWANTDDKP